MAQYQYVDQSGGLRTVEADSPQAAIATAANRDPHSGVSLVQGEPAVLSTAGGQTSFQQNVQPTIDRANQNLLSSQQQKPKEEKETLPPELQAEADALKTFEQRQSELWERQRQTAQAQYEAMVSLQSRSAQAQIASLQQQWNQRRAELEQSIRGNVATWKQAFIRFGTAEYSPGITGDFISAKEQEGQRKLADLDSAYTSKIASINAALEANVYSEAARLTKELQRIEEQVMETISSNIKEAREVNKKYRERAKLADTQELIIDLFDQGLTEAVDIFNYAKILGRDIPLKDIEDTLKIIRAPEIELTGASADLRTFALLYPDLKVGTEEFRTQYSRFVATQAALKRKPVTEKGTPGAITIPTFDQFVDEFIQTPKGQELINKIQQQRGQTLLPEVRRQLVAEQIRDLYDQTVEQLRAQQGENPGDYTDQELRKLRQAGIDPRDVEAADEFLYGPKKKAKTTSDLSDEEFLEELKRLSE